MQREVLILVVSVVAIDVVALAARQYFRIGTMGRDANVWFTAAWMVLTLLVVLPRLSRIRGIRDQGRRARRR